MSLVGLNRAFKKARGLWSKLSPGFGLIYCGLSSEPGPTGSGLGPFQLYTPYTNLLCNVRVWELTIVADAKGNCDSNDTDDDDDNDGDNNNNDGNASNDGNIDSGDEDDGDDDDDNHGEDDNNTDGDDAHGKKNNHHKRNQTDLFFVRMCCGKMTSLGTTLSKLVRKNVG